MSFGLEIHKIAIGGSSTTFNWTLVIQLELAFDYFGIAWNYVKTGRSNNMD